MVAITPTRVTEVASSHEVWRYAAIASDDTHGAIILPRKPMEIIIAAVGTGTATLTAHGSLDGTNFFPLNDLGGTAFSISASTTVAGKAVREAPLYLRVVSASGSTPSFTVDVLIRWI